MNEQTTTNVWNGNRSGAPDFWLGTCLQPLLPLCSASQDSGLRHPNTILASTGSRLDSGSALEGAIPATTKPHTQHLKYVPYHLGLSVFCHPSSPSTPGSFRNSHASLLLISRVADVGAVLSARPADEPREPGLEKSKNSTALACYVSLSKLHNSCGPC